MTTQEKHMQTFMAEWVQRTSESEIRRLLRYSTKYYFAGGKPGVIPLKIFHKIIYEIIDEENTYYSCKNPKYLDNYNYGPTEGNSNLRSVLRDRLVHFDGLSNIAVDDVVLTNGSQQALYALCDLLIKPGDIFLSTRPTYLGFLQPAEKLGATIVTLPSDNNGLIPEYIPKAFTLTQERFSKTPKILYCVPYSDNPKGTTLTESRKKAILDYAFELDFLIIEDMAYKEIQFTNRPLSPMKKLDKSNERIMYVSTSTKEAAAFRIGYNVIPEFLQNDFVKVKGIYDLCSSEWVQAILTKYYSKYIDKTLPDIRKAYKKRRDAMVKACDEYLNGYFSRPTGGFFVWFESHDKNLNTSLFIEKALTNDVSYVPGASFFPRYGFDLTRNDKLEESSPEYNTMRLGYSLLEPPLIQEGIQRLGELLSNV
ncbi:MAG: aminotransferase-like domain-containing protein [Candidatus Hodarchaeales archaeon]